MAVNSAQLPSLNTDDVPAEARSWVDRSLLTPLNRALELMRTALNRGISLRSHINCQVIERRFTAPSGTDWSTERLDTPLTLTGPCLGFQVLSASTIDSAGHDIAPVGGLAAPAWREVVGAGAPRSVRLVYQNCLTAGVRYRIVYLAWGG